MAREAGFEAAFTTEPGVCDAAADPWALPRFTPWDRGEFRFRLRLLANQRRRRSALHDARPSAPSTIHRTGPA
jgi:hypothetical protein